MGIKSFFLQVHAHVFLYAQWSFLDHLGSQGELIGWDSSPCPYVRSNFQNEYF